VVVGRVCKRKRGEVEEEEEENCIITSVILFTLLQVFLE
jgi:hypothetical protein